MVNKTFYLTCRAGDQMRPLAQAPPPRVSKLLLPRLGSYCSLLGRDTHTHTLRQMNYSWGWLTIITSWYQLDLISAPPPPQPAAKERIEVSFMIAKCTFVFTVANIHSKLCHNVWFLFSLLPQGALRLQDHLLRAGLHAAAAGGQRLRLVPELRSHRSDVERRLHHPKVRSCPHSAGLASRQPCATFMATGVLHTDGENCGKREEMKWRSSFFF